MPVKLHVTSSLLPQKKFTKKRRKTMNRNRQTFYDTRTWRSTEDNIRCDFSGMFLPLCEAPCGATLCHMQNVANFIGIGIGIDCVGGCLPLTFPLLFMLTRHFAVNIFSFAGWDFGPCYLPRVWGKEHFMRSAHVNAGKYFYWICYSDRRWRPKSHHQADQSNYIIREDLKTHLQPH